jgi:hypothetical protein
MNRRAAASTTASLVLTTLALVAAATSVWSQGAYLNDAQLRETLVDHTIKGSGWAEFYRQDGVIVGRLLTFGMSYQGTWRIANGTVCYDYEGTAQDTCSRLMRDGDTVRHFTLSGSPKTDGVATRQAGNQTATR